MDSRVCVSSSWVVEITCYVFKWIRHIVAEIVSNSSLSPSIRGQEGYSTFNITMSKISCYKTRFQIIFQLKHGTVWASVPVPNLALTWYLMGIAGSWSVGRGHVMRARSKLPCQDTWCNSLDNSCTLAQHLICQSARLGITSTLEIGLAIKDQSNHWIKLVEWRAGPNLISSIRRGRATLDLTSSKLSSGHEAFAILLFKTYRIRDCSNFKAISDTFHL